MYNKEEVLGFITDTVWGIGCHPLNKNGVDKIYELKERDRSKPLILMSYNIENLLPYVKDVPNYADKLIKKFLPGAITLIFKKTDACPDYITSNYDTVGIRIPDCKDFFNLAKSFEDGVLATTSLNFSNNPSVKNYNEAKELFGDKIKIVKPENEDLTSDIASTVVLCTEKEPKILRQGEIII